MNWIDYRKSLGLSFSDIDKQVLFIKRVEVFMQSKEDFPFEEESERDFAYMIGSSYLLADISPFNIQLGTDPIGLQRAWLYLSKRTKSFLDFLSCTVALINTYHGKVSDKKELANGIKKALADSHIEFEILKDDDGIFIFPQGAKELDDALVSQPLAWLKDYPQGQAAFATALKSYSNVSQDTASLVADNFRKVLETFFQEFFGSAKSLENLKSEYGTYLKNKGIPKEISSNFEKLLELFTNFNNNYAKHQNKTECNVVEFIMYQTGNIIRLLITLSQGEKNNEAK